jgi:ankyrin repeat protein
MVFRYIQTVTLILLAIALTSLATAGEIHDASKHGDLEKVKALLEENPALACSKDETGWTPLHLAAQKGFKEVAELLLANKADPNAKSKRGDTPLHWAANGHKEIVALLLANKAKVDIKDNNGTTPLSRAVMQGHREVAELIRLYGGHA